MESLPIQKDLRQDRETISLWESDGAPESAAILALPDQAPAR